MHMMHYLKGTDILTRKRKRDRGREGEGGREGERGRERERESEREKDGERDSERERERERERESERGREREGEREREESVHTNKGYTYFDCSLQVIREEPTHCGLPLLGVHIFSSYRGREKK